MSWTIAWYTIEWLMRLAAVFVVPTNRKPSSGTAWLMLIFFLPLPGWILFWLIGSPKLPSRRRQAQKMLGEKIQEAIMTLKKNQPSTTKFINAPVKEKYQSTARLAENLTSMPVVSGNTIEPIAEYNDIIQTIIADIKTAEHSVYIEFYVLALDDVTAPLFDMIRSKVQQGVEVYVLYDQIGSRKYPRYKEMRHRLSQIGAKHNAMLPISFSRHRYTRPDLRNHRKLVAIDGRIGYTGSLNMVQRDYHRKDSIYYDEMMVRITGPLVFELEAIFIGDWYAETGDGIAIARSGAQASLRIQGSTAHIVPSGPGYDYENNLKIFNTIFYTAKKRITIVNPYFVPDESLIMTLISATRRGVEVTLINSAAIDQVFVAHAQRSYYEELLRAGVKIYLYNLPKLLHSKFIMIDDDAALIGSSNMDIRSFELDHELTLLAYDEQLVATLDGITANYIKNAQLMSLQEWLKRPRRKQMIDNIARLTSTLQ